MSEAEAYRRADEAAQAASAERYAREHGLVAPDAERGVRQPTAAEHIAMLGGVEHASAIAGDPNIPLEPFKVISDAELTAQHAALRMRSISGQPYRVPQNHPVPPSSPRPIESKFIRDSLDEGYTWG